MLQQMGAIPENMMEGFILVRDIKCVLLHSVQQVFIILSWPTSNLVSSWNLMRYAMYSLRFSTFIDLDLHV